jgi:type II secretory ATPase GspE/PulE/Tfp pilus assembly ATPase PilB-like protein
VTGEKIVLRLFNGVPFQTLRELQLPESACDELEGFLRRNSGLLLLTGPAGSGKTTTIYGCLRYLAGLGGRHIITVEDPVEQILPGVMQTEVNEPRGLTFATAARHLLRQDPQVLVIGEIRDQETANIAVRAALTGHLVISTLHAGSCRSVFERLLLLCPDGYAAISAVELVLNQRLVRRVCRQCRGSGCDSCLGTGYQGRQPILESVRITEAVRRQLRDSGPETIQARPSLQDAAKAMVENGLTNPAEYERFFGP